MNLGQLIAAARADVDDTVVPYKCTDEQFTRFANWAENEACRRGRLLLDSSTPEICTLNLAIGDDSVDLDERVLFVRRAKLVGRSVPLGRVSFRRLDREAPDWQSETGEIRAWVPDMADLQFRPYPIPTVASVVNLTVTRLPFEAMDAEDDAPEIRSHLHEALVHGMRYRYYTLPDEEMYDPKLAEQALGLFELEFGKKSSGLDEAWLSREADQLEDEGQF